MKLLLLLLLTFAKQQERKNARYSSVEKKINSSMALDFLFTRTS